MPVDPTQTGTARRSYNSNVQRRWRGIQLWLRDWLATEDRLGLGSGPGFKDVSGPLRGFRDVLRQQIDRLVLEIQDEHGRAILPRGTQWQDPYVHTAYGKGVARAQRWLLTTDPSLTAPLRDTWAFAVQRDTLSQRNFQALARISEATVSDVVASLGAAITPTTTAADMARLAIDRVQTIARVRSQVMAHTELVHAYSEGTLDEYQRQDVALAIPQVELNTVGDIRVCIACLTLASTDTYGYGAGVYPLAKARGVIPVHALCRCAWLPAGFVGQRRDRRTQRLVEMQRRIETLQASPEARTEQRLASSPPRRRRRAVAV